ncbi:MAG: hypothetical protein WD711_00525 [Dongiaceae bacterium]
MPAPRINLIPTPSIDGIVRDLQVIAGRFNELSSLVDRQQQEIEKLKRQVAAFDL